MQWFVSFEVGKKKKERGSTRILLCLNQGAGMETYNFPGFQKKEEGRVIIFNIFSSFNSSYWKEQSWMTIGHST